MNYVLGFAIQDGKVLMIEKNRPDWQAGKLNGIGGKVEESDLCPLYAMVREFSEETGIETIDSDWKYITAIHVNNIDSIHIYKSTTIEFIGKHTDMTDEKLRVCYLNDILRRLLKTVSNVPWIINMLFDEDFQNRNITIQYNAIT